MSGSVNNRFSLITEGLVCAELSGGLGLGGVESETVQNGFRCRGSEAGTGSERRERKADELSGGGEDEKTRQTHRRARVLAKD